MPPADRETGEEISMAKPDAPRIAILGAGPIGLEAALYARTLHLPVTVYERGRIGEHLHRWGHVRLFSPFGMNYTSLGRGVVLEANARHEFPADTECIAGRQHISAYLEPLARSPKLREVLRTETQVVQVARRGFLKEDSPGDSRRAQQPFRLLLREAKKGERVEEADMVLDCTGTYGQHRWMGDGGVPAVGELAAESQISYGLDDILGDRRAGYAGKNVLVIGTGYSAATAVCNLATVAEAEPGTWVIWLARGSSTAPLKRIANDPLRERDRLAVRANTLATRTDGNVEFHHQSVVESIETAGPDRGFRVTARSSGKLRTWDVERIIANVGYTPDTNLYRELQIHECYASLGPMNLAAALLKYGGADCLAIPGQGAQTLRNPEPGFFILGAKSYGRNSNFLLRNGFEQVRDVFKLITGKNDLDLYKKQ
jgi:thioredoxin reductase